MEIIKKLKDVSFKNGKFLSDKSQGFDCIYFVSKFINEYQENGKIELKNTETSFMDYINDIFKIEETAVINNYRNETSHVLLYANIIKKIKSANFDIIDQELLDFITERIENAYIFNYVLCYFTIKNIGLLEEYKKFCEIKDENLKLKILMNIHEKLTSENPSVDINKKDEQWAKQNTKYIINNLNFLNNNKAITRKFNFNSICDVKDVAVNISGTKTTKIKDKKNSYIETFDKNYVREYLNALIIYKGDVD